MSAFLALAVVLMLAAGTIAMLRLDAARIAGALRMAGPAALGVVGVAMLFLGRAGLGGMLISGAVAWYTAGLTRRRGAIPSPGKRSMVRTAALEMELDHDSGALSGHVLAGSFEGRALAQLDLEQLKALGRELADDPESLQLLETYLDGRFAFWRDDAEANAGEGLRGAPASGPMTKQEAYQILGLEPGASVAEIRKAHRRLMQRLHPDLGGTSFLAARINGAKDVLLSDHD